MELTVEKIVEGLNERQREAVTFGTGPLLVVAGAGTGKTKVITYRIAYLTGSKMAAPEEILALTFTDKAAAEMEERVDVLLPYGYANINVSTFHAFGDKILREYAIDLGMTSDLRVLSQPEQYIFFRENLFEFPLNYYRPLGDPTQFIHAILNLISRAKDEDVSPDDYLRYAENLLAEAGQHPEDETLQDEAGKQMEIARTYRVYQELLTKQGNIDFGDQVWLVLKLFRENPSVLQRVRKQFRFILVDEFQDTNFAQFQLLKLLAGDGQNITVVGDDDQSIYKFRGAAISNILEFTDVFPSAQKVVLKENYRSSQAILDAAYRLIQHNNPDRLEVKINIDKQLVAHFADLPPMVEHLHHDTLTSEADAVAGLILKKKKENSCNYREFAILVRTNNDADPFLRSLNMRSIPYRFSGNRGLYQQPEIQLLLSFLRVIGDIEDSVSLFHLASSEIYMLKMVDLQRCSRLAKKQNLTLYAVFENLGESEPAGKISTESIATIRKILRDIDYFLQMSRDKSTGVVLYEYLDNTTYLKKLANFQKPENDLKVQNIAKFFDIVRGFGYVAQVDRVQNFVNYLDMLIEAGDNPATADADIDTDAVHVLTVHKAKGLEFPVTFLVGLVQQKFPHNRRAERLSLPDELVREAAPEANSHLQEERRLFYVAMTRAQKELYLTSGRDYGGVRPRKVSQFVTEALDRPVADEDYVRASAMEQIARNAPVNIKHTDLFAPIPDDELISLSFYQIDDYLTCPLKYKYVHVLRVPILPHHSVIYGKALHEAVEEYLRRKIRSLPMSPDEMIRVFKDSWISEGFISREHERLRFLAGQETLTQFYNNQQKETRLPTFIEKEFSFIWEHNRIVGRWDRIDKTDAGVEILDYKSSNVREQEKADKRAKESLQLRIYAIAYHDNYHEYPSRVKLHFLESGLTGSVEVQPKMIDKAYDKIMKAAQGIRRRNYEATPGYMSCHYCAFANICPAAKG